MNRGGRKRHNFWEEMGFKKIKDEKGNPAVYCEGCKNIFKNSAQDRLQKHRYVYITVNISVFNISIYLNKYILQNQLRSKC